MRVFVSVIVLSLTSASDMFNVNEKPELARGHALQNRAWEKRLHITRERTLSKSIWEAGFDIYVCDSHILQQGRVDRVVQDIFSGDAWLNNLIRLTWQAKMKRCVPALRPLVHFDMRVESYNLIHRDKFDTAESPLKRTQIPQ